MALFTLPNKSGLLLGFILLIKRQRCLTTDIMTSFYCLFPAVTMLLHSGNLWHELMAEKKNIMLKLINEDFAHEMMKWLELGKVRETKLATHQCLSIRYAYASCHIVQALH